MRPPHAQQRGGGITLGDIDQHPRPDRYPAPRLLVAAQGKLVGGATGEVPVGTGIESLAGEALELGEGLGQLHAAVGVRQGPYLSSFESRRSLSTRPFVCSSGQ